MSVKKNARIPDRREVSGRDQDHSCVVVERQTVDDDTYSASTPYPENNYGWDLIATTYRRDASVLSDRRIGSMNGIFDKS